MHVDPICGMKVEEKTGLRAERGGKTWFFCSEHCRKQFLARPASPNQTPTAAPSSHSCCGFESTPTTKDDHACCHAPATPEGSHSCCHDHAATVRPAASTGYYCPMCAGVESDRP